MVEADRKLPHRKEVLSILRNQKQGKDARMRRLYKLRGGYPYSYIRKNILPYLRTATTCVVYWTADALAEKETLARVTKEPLRLEKVGGGSMLLSLPIAEFTPAPYTKPTEQIVEQFVEQPTQESVSEPSKESVSEPSKEESMVRFATKTNLLFDAVGAVNVGLEIPVNNSWSVDLGWTFPWYLSKEWDWCYQLLWGDVEVRRWLGERTSDNRLMGHFVGLYAGGGLYDFQWRSTDGYQGEFFIAAGISYGYSMKLNNNWNLEFEIGLGYLQSDYRHYFHITDAQGEEILIRDNVSGRFGYWGPTKAKVSLVIPIRW